MKCGVLQGSILYPLLFIIYMNDICNMPNSQFTIMCADDTVVLHLYYNNYIVLLSGKGLSDLICLLNNKALEFISTWLKQTFDLLFHRARLKVILFQM